MNLKDSIIETTAKVSNKVVQKAPELLAGTGIACFIASTFMAVKVTPKAHDILEEKKKELQTEELPVKETIKAVGKLYLPAVVSGTAGIFFVLSSVSESNKRYVVLSTSYELAREAANTYKEKVIETIGEKKAEKIESSIKQDQIDNNPPQSNVNVLVPPEDGQHRVLYYEPITKQYFWEKPNKIERAALNAMKESREAFEYQYSAYSWISKLPSSIMSNLPDGEIDYLMNIGWPTMSQYGDEELLYIDVTKEVHSVTKGEWEGYPCVYITYGAMPMPNYKSGY